MKLGGKTKIGRKTLTETLIVRYSTVSFNCVFVYIYNCMLVSWCAFVITSVRSVLIKSWLKCIPWFLVRDKKSIPGIPIHKRIHTNKNKSDKI